MSPPPRRLVISVGSSLLTASLALGVSACDSGQTVNPVPEPSDDGPAQDDGAKPEPTVNPAPEPKPEPDVNTGPKPVEDPMDEGPTEPELAKPVQPKHVNTGPKPVEAPDKTPAKTP